MSQPSSGGRQLGGFQIMGVRKEPEPVKREEDVGTLLRTTDDDREPARALVRAAFLLLKTAMMYDLGNAAVAAPLDGMLSAAKVFLDQDAVASLQRRHDGFYVNNALVARDAAMAELYPFLEFAFERLAVHELLLQRGVDKQAMRVLLKHFQGRMTGTSAAGEHRWETVQLRELPDERALAARRERERVVSNYALACVRMSEALNGFAKGLAPNLARLRSALAPLLDLAPSLEPVLLAALGLTREKPSAWSHAVNCAVLVGLVGKRLGLERPRLLSMASAAALHPLERVLPQPSSDKRRSIKLLVQVQGQGEELAERLVAMAEAGAGLSDSPHVVSRLIRLVSAFEDLVAGSEARAPLTLDEAIRVLGAEAGRRHDPRLFAVFARTIGFFPIGSVVQLATGEAAVVAGVPSDPAKLLQPPVILATGPNPGALANLALPEQAPRRIVRAALPSELGVNPLRWLVGG